MAFTYHNSIYEFPTGLHSRTQEYKIFEWIEEQVSKHGSRAYSARKNNYDYILYKDPKNAKLYQTDEVFGEAANLLKVGLDIIFLISQSGSWGCYRNLRKLMEERYEKKVRVHPVVGVYEGIHIDTTFSIVGYNKKVEKFIVVVNGNTVTPKNIPALFRGKNWAVIEFSVPVVDQVGYE